MMEVKPEPNWEYHCKQYVDFEQLDGEVGEEGDLYFGGVLGEKPSLENEPLSPEMEPDSSTTAVSRKSLRRSPRVVALNRKLKTDDQENVPDCDSGSLSVDRKLRPRATSGMVEPPSNSSVFGLQPSYSWKDVPYTPPKPLKKKRLSRDDSNMSKRRSPLAMLQSHGSALRQKTLAQRHRFGNAISSVVRGPLRALQSLGGNANVTVTEEAHTDLSEKVDFASMLRRYDSPKKGQKTLPRNNTVPSPFSFADKKSGRSSTVNPSFRSVAEQVIAFQTKTPLRFRTVQRNGGQAEGGSRGRDPSPPVRAVAYQAPQTPRLMTRGRQRTVNVPSQQDLEEREVEEMKKSQFHAKPFNPAIFNESAMGVPMIVRRPVTVAEPFKLSSGTQPARNVEEEPAHVKFQARPVPRAVLEPPKDLRSLRQPIVTCPKSPAFALRNRVHRSETTRASSTGLPANMLQRQGSLRGTSSFAGPVPAAAAGSSRDDHRPLTATRVQPFTFDDQVRGMAERRQRRLQEVLEREKREREFHARPHPDFSAVSLPPKESRPATKPEPFDLKVEIRGAVKEDKIKKLLDEEAASRRAMATFKAGPCKVIYEDPFCPERSERTLTVVPQLHLSTEQRALERERFDAEVRARDEQIAAVVRERAERREKEEAAEEAAMRAAAVHRAQPVRHYRPVEVKPCDRSPVHPISPDLATKKRKRNA